MGLSLFPVRVPIARIQVNGQTYDALMTPEFSRALSDLFEQVGGDSGTSAPDTELLSIFSDAGAGGNSQATLQDAFADAGQVMAAVSALREEVQALRTELAMAQNHVGLEQQIEDINKNIAMNGGSIFTFVPGSATGSRAGNAALASLLSALAVSGLVINNTVP